MLRKKIHESLTTHIFLITALVLLGAGTITFGLIAWATPSTYTAVLNDDLTGQVNTLVEKLEDTTLEDCGPILDAFLRDSGADAMLVGPDEQIINTGSQFAIQSVYEDTGTVSAAEDSSAVTYATDVLDTDESVSVTMSDQATIVADVHFSDRLGVYTLYVTPRLQAENLAVKALIQMAPWLLLSLLIFSLLGALVYSRYITRPIVRLSGIAGKMADLDFSWTCEETRQDEIGHLGRSLNQMAQKLSNALRELKASNEALRGEMEQERELDRQRMAFFSAASHELKTPVTILRGQLSGMLDGVDVYRDREKYLARSLQVTARMEKLIQEILTISRMEAQDISCIQEKIDVSEIVGRQLKLDADLIQQRHLNVTADLCPNLIVYGDPSMLAKVIGNLLSNAALYSPDGEEIRIWTGLKENSPTLTIENTGVHIGTAALPHLFEAFYREEQSRNRRTGGSGLGLYLVRIILDRHGAKCWIDNTAEGVLATVCFKNPQSCKGKRALDKIRRTLSSYKTHIGSISSPYKLGILWLKFKREEINLCKLNLEI